MSHIRAFIYKSTKYLLFCLPFLLPIPCTTCHYKCLLAILKTKPSEWTFWHENIVTCLGHIKLSCNLFFEDTHFFNWEAFNFIVYCRLLYKFYTRALIKRVYVEFFSLWVLYETILWIMNDCLEEWVWVVSIPTLVSHKNNYSCEIKIKEFFLYGSVTDLKSCTSFMNGPFSILINDCSWLKLSKYIHTIYQVIPQKIDGHPMYKPYLLTYCLIMIKICLPFSFEVNGNLSVSKMRYIESNER